MPSSNMSTPLDRVSDQIDRFIQDHEAFQDACDRVFGKADRNEDGKQSPTEVADNVDLMFQDIEDVLEASQIKVEKPTKAKIQEILDHADIDGDRSLDEEEFAKLYAQACLSS